jgi:hypothetical protein
VAKGPHLVDTALAFATLEDSGVLQTVIAKRYRKSAGYVSVCCRLGRALWTASEGDRATLRDARVGIKAAQRIVRREARPPEVLAALGALVTIAKPAHRRRRGAGAGGTWRGLGAHRATRDAWTFAWDDTAARRDPRAYLAAFEEFLHDVNDEVVDRLRTLIRTGTDVATDRAVEQGPPGAELPHRPPPTLEERRLGELSLRQLYARVDEQRRVARAAVEQELARRRQGVDKGL